MFGYYYQNFTSLTAEINGHFNPIQDGPFWDAYG